jgi:hypothetical protein
MSRDEFVRVCDRFTTKSLFQCEADGRLIKDDAGNLNRINDDNVDV